MCDFCVLFSRRYMLPIFSIYCIMFVYVIFWYLFLYIDSILMRKYAFHLDWSELSCRFLRPSHKHIRTHILLWMPCNYHIVIKWMRHFSKRHIIKLLQKSCVIVVMCLCVCNILERIMHSSFLYLQINIWPAFNSHISNWHDTKIWPNRLYKKKIIKIKCVFKTSWENFQK